MPITRCLAACLFGISAVAIFAQSSTSDPVRWSESLSQNYLVYPDQHALLDAARQANELYTVPGGKHGMFGKEADERAYEHVWEFLEHYVPSLPARGHDPLDKPKGLVAH